MAIVRIPVPGAWVKDKRYVIEFDSDKMTGVEMTRGMVDIGGQQEFDGTNRITLKFDNFADAPRWVEVLWSARKRLVPRST
jgi:hypothetical protein